MRRIGNADTMAETDSFDTRMSRPMNRRQDWIDSGFSGDREGRIKKELHTLPAGISKIHR
jgi:hypothetical protein